jgi:hypothetical protein
VGCTTVTNDALADRSGRLNVCFLSQHVIAFQLSLSGIDIPSWEYDKRTSETLAHFGQSFFAYREWSADEIFEKDSFTESTKTPWAQQSWKHGAS